MVYFVWLLVDVFIYNSLILQLCVQTELYKVGTMGYRVCDTGPADLTNHTTEQIISSGSHWWTTGRIVSNPVDWDVSLAYVTCVLYVVYKYARIVSLLDWKISTKIIKLLNYCGEDPVCASDDKVSDTALESILWNLCANHWVFISFDETKRFLVMKLIAVHVKLAKGDRSEVTQQGILSLWSGCLKSQPMIRTTGRHIRGVFTSKSSMVLPQDIGWVDINIPIYTHRKHIHYTVGVSVWK